MGRNTRRLLIAALVVLGAGVAGAQTTPTMTATTTAPTTSPSTLAATATPSVEQIVAIARTVESGAGSVTAFTVPTGHQLVVTDVVITNPSATPVCGAAISPSGATLGTTTSTTGASTTPTTTGATTPSTATADTGTITSTGGTTTTTTPGGSTVTAPSASAAGTAAVESGTGTLCVPAQTSLTLSLTTGLEFAGGQSVVLANQPLTTTTATPATTTATPAAATATTGPLFYHLRGFLVSSGV